MERGCGGVGAGLGRGLGQGWGGGWGGVGAGVGELFLPAAPAAADAELPAGAHAKHATDTDRGTETQ